MSKEINFEQWRPHPWHGLTVGQDPPRLLHAYVEMTPFDAVKYEIDKITGYLRVDRPQITSSLPPTIYGFVPRTYCGERVAALSETVAQGDGDPLDICVLSERPINRAEVLLNARVIGGLRLIDKGEADDKIIAVLEKDPAWEMANELADIPERLIERLRHYFVTYKQIPGKEVNMYIEAVYGFEAAVQVIQASIADYEEIYGD